ncbi:SURF1 family protein [Streptomyces sp. JJ36]|uniref:SURF1 family protein n=1 Tax=Streptomyces sp. JJ36 TaxID=2736645 RepID=UPI001F3EAEF0|nr:SURF1 family protein [Streptomyces sp. JJ36]MCF6524272.1 SURF1 family protein [Streptomyces sp. JJ36]
MYRFLLAPRWWAINVFVVLSIPVCLFMGSWQLSRFEARVDSHREQQEQAGEQPSGARAEPLTSLLPVDKRTSGRTAEATGRYDARHTLLVPDRMLDGERGFYVLSLLRTDAGPALPVVRGWLPGKADPDRAPAPPRGEVTVRGALQAPETEGSPGVRTAGGLPEGQLGMVSAAALVNVVPYDVHEAWITVQRTEAPLRPVPPVAAAGTGLDMKAFQNLGYTAEWFVFAGFVLFMWYRLFRRDAEPARDAALGLTPPAPAPPGAGGTGDPGEQAAGFPGDPEVPGGPEVPGAPGDPEAPSEPPAGGTTAGVGGAGRTRSPGGAA